VTRGNSLGGGRGQSFYVLINRLIKETVAIIQAYHFYPGISLLSTTYKILSNILLSRLTPYSEESNGDHQCEF